MTDSDSPQGPIDATVVPRFAGPLTFGRLPTAESVGRPAVAVVGVPFDGGTTYRPGARFGPAAIREASRLLRPYHSDLGVAPFAVHQVADAGDIACTPFNIEQAVDQITAGARDLLARADTVIALGGDHTVALPLLRATAEKHGPVAVIHFDAHLDTWEGHFGNKYNHGTPFRRASEEGLMLRGQCVHVGTRGPIFSADDLGDDANLGFAIVPAMDFEKATPSEIAARIRDLVGDAPTYISIDIDVLDPAFAPGTGTPEAGGLTSRELLGVLRELVDLNIVGADVVEVAPAYDWAETTATAACHVAYELLSILALRAERASST